MFDNVELLKGRRVDLPIQDVPRMTSLAFGDEWTDDLWGRIRRGVLTYEKPNSIVIAIVDILRECPALSSNAISELIRATNAFPKYVMEKAILLEVLTFRQEQGF